jgi:hypothetical protein
MFDARGTVYSVAQHSLNAPQRAGAARQMGLEIVD